MSLVATYGSFPTVSPHFAVMTSIMARKRSIVHVPRIARLSCRCVFVKYLIVPRREATLRRNEHVTHSGRTAIVVAAVAALSLIVIDAAAAKTKKHKTVPPAPTQQAQPAAGGTATGGEAKAKQEPSSNPEKTSGAPDEKASNTWTESEIADAKAHCAVVLARIHAVTAAHEPIKNGACGAPAPVELISIGQNPEVTLSPPPVVRCDLAEALVNWLEKDLQPLAQKHFHSPIVKIETMSDYSCRNAYGRKSTKLSEHGLANAVDIGSFVTASHAAASVLGDWGTTQREVLARIAEAKAAAEKKAADLAAAEKAEQANLANDGKASSKTGAQAASALGAPAAGLARSTIVDGVPKVTVTLPGAGDAQKTASNADEPARLGGPAPGPEMARSRKGRGKKTSGKADAQTPEVRAFLHEAHAAACRIFGTTLGPEANPDHINHFHVDMAPRRFTKICD
jgi:hypothetical protein